MSTDQQAMVDGVLRRSAFPVGSTAQEQAYHAILDEAAAALDRAGRLLSEHLARAALVAA